MSSPTAPSAFTCIGRSACRSARIATSTATCAMAAIDEARFVRAFDSRNRHDRRARTGPHGIDDLLRRRHAVADAAGDGAVRSSKPLRKHWSVAPDAEVTLEANPTSVEATRFRGYRAAGVNRVSLGVQALDDRCAQASSAACTPRRKRSTPSPSRARIFDRYSFDLIYARPQPDADAWGAELKRAHRGSGRASVALSTDHRAGNAVLRAARSPASSSRPTKTLARALYDITQEICGGARPCRPTRFPITRGPARNAGTIWSTGAGMNMPASARARMAGSTSTAIATPPRPRSARKSWLMRVESLGHGVTIDETAAAPSEAPTNSC